jgi:hypothetical protein
MLLRISIALRWRVLKGRSLSAAANRAGEMGVASLDIMRVFVCNSLRVCRYVVEIVGMARRRVGGVQAT